VYNVQLALMYQIFADEPVVGIEPPLCEYFFLPAGGILAFHMLTSFMFFRPFEHSEQAQSQL
jgi:hypothetical protein